MKKLLIRSVGAALLVTAGLIASPAHRKLAAVPSWLRCRVGTQGLSNTGNGQWR